jgi:hypothetical protein
VSESEFDPAPEVGGAQSPGDVDAQEVVEGRAADTPADDGRTPDLSAAAPADSLERTGNPVVDSVLDSLRHLDDVPVSEHVAVFEAAHDRLRAALSDAGEPPTDS